MVMSATNAKVLVVDDDATVRELVKALLSQNGYDVREAADGEAALGSLVRDPVEIVLIDILMPRKEGLETIIELKQRFPNLVVLAMSASGTRKGHDFLSIAAKFGADGILQKPFSPDELLGLMGSHSTSKRSAGLARLVGK